MNIAFLGDSITLGLTLTNQADRYTTEVCRRLGAEEQNFGITATLVAKAGLNATDGKDFVSRIHLINDADVAVIFGGTNDYFWSDHPIEGEDEQYFAAALQTIIHHVKDRRAGKLTLFVTPYPHNGIGNFWGGAHFKDINQHDTDQRNFNGHSLKDYADTIESLCEKNGIPCLNLHNAFPFDWRLHTTDGCHPNEQGHRLLADVISNKLTELLKK